MESLSLITEKIRTEYGGLSSERQWKYIKNTIKHRRKNNE